MCFQLWLGPHLTHFVTKDWIAEKLARSPTLPMPAATDLPVAQALETVMKKKVLVIGAIASAVVLAGGWAIAQPLFHGPGGFGPPFMQGGTHGGMDPGMMMKHMGPGMMKGPGMGPGMMRGGPGLTFADPAQLETLKKELAVTTAQEPAWAKYTKTLQDAATAMKTARDGINPESIAKLGPQERFAFATKMREQAQKQHDAVKAAANELLTTLDDAQKTKAQQTLPGLAFGPGAMHGAFMRGPH
jgi:hypothetical protein